MNSDWRKVNRVVLHEHYTVLTDPESDGGIFADYEFETWRFEGESIARLLTAIGIDVEPVKGVVGPHIELTRIPAHTGKNVYDDAVLKEISGIGKIEARVLGMNLLDLRLTYHVGTKDEFAEEITYSGGFTVEWMTA